MLILCWGLYTHNYKPICKSKEVLEIDRQIFDGFRVQFSQPLSRVFHAAHTLTLGGSMQPGYTLATTYGRERWALQTHADGGQVVASVLVNTGGKVSGTLSGTASRAAGGAVSSLMQL